MAFYHYLCKMCFACHSMLTCFICPRFSFTVNGMYDIFVNIHVLVVEPDVNLEVFKAWLFYSNYWWCLYFIQDCGGKYQNLFRTVIFPVYYSVAFGAGAFCVSKILLYLFAYTFLQFCLMIWVNGWCDIFLKVAVSKV